MKKLMELSRKRGVKSTSTTAGATLGIGGIAALSGFPVPETLFMMGAVVVAGAAIAYTKSVDKVKDCE